MMREKRGKATRQGWETDRPGLPGPEAARALRAEYRHAETTGAMPASSLMFCTDSLLQVSHVAAATFPTGLK